MNKEILEKINSEKYDFLRKDKSLGENIVFLALSGSYGYGTNVSGSDIDLRGFLIEGEEVLFQLSSFEQFECRETDTVIYGLKKFVTLALNGNPQILELLGLPEDCIVSMSEEGRVIYENREIFLSKKVIKTFGNYAVAQLRRLENALCHDVYSVEKKERHLLNSLGRQIEEFNNENKGGINLYFNEDEKEIFVKGEVKDMALSKFVAFNSSIANVMGTYKKLNHRNNKKDEKKLYKHGMHLIRMLITGEKILEGKGIVTRLNEDIPLLMDIRNGKYSFDEIFELARVYEERFNYAGKETNLPENPDKERAEELMSEIYKSYLRRKRLKD